MNGSTRASPSTAKQHCARARFVLGPFTPHMTDPSDTSQQCHPQVERDILLLARQLQSEWVPHLLSAFQTPDKLVFVMSYYDGGSLWDIVEALGEGTPVPESDLSWWMPQAVCAIEWCHSHGIAHRWVLLHLARGVRLCD